MPSWQERLGGLRVEELPGGLRLHQAVSYGERRRGLAGLPELPPGVGLHIHSCRAIHTVGMRFGLDLLWLGPDGELVRIDRAVPPRRQRICGRARTVVEVAEGGADRWAPVFARSAFPLDCSSG